jgi:hypothetical protein
MKYLHCVINYNNSEGKAQGEILQKVNKLSFSKFI